MRIFIAIMAFILVIGMILLSVLYGIQEKWAFMICYIVSALCWLFVAAVNTYLAIEER